MSLPAESTPMMVDDDDAQAGARDLRPSFQLLGSISHLTRKMRSAATSLKRKLYASPQAEEMSLWDIPNMARYLLLLLWSRTSRRLRLTLGLILVFLLSISLSVALLPMPSVSLEYAVSNTHRPEQPKPKIVGPPPLDPTKVALLIENRPMPHLAPLMLHFISVVPPDWRFRFMGSLDSVQSINKSSAIREQVQAGKLDLTYIPSNMSTENQEMLSRFLTNLWLYQTVLQPAELLLVFQTDSIICANSRHNINEYTQYDWVGAPWDPNGQWGGNGGLSIRRVSAIIDVLQRETREEGGGPEDVWLASRMASRPNARMCNGSVSETFSGEMHDGPHVWVSTGNLDAAAEGEYVASLDSWRKGFYEPMGYHTGSGGRMLHGPIWGSPERREHIWKYCPEVKMTLHMDVARFIPGHCHNNWRRDDNLTSSDDSASLDDGQHSQPHDPSAYPHGTEVINGVEYPLLPPGLVPW